MNLLEFEKIIRSGLSNQTVDLDTELFMQRLFEPKKEKRRIVVFWWGIGILSLTIGSLFFFNPPFYDKSNTDSTDLPQRAEEVLVHADHHSSNFLEESKKIENEGSAMLNVNQKKYNHSVIPSRGDQTYTNSVQKSFQASSSNRVTSFQKNANEQEKDYFEMVNTRLHVETPENLTGPTLSTFTKPKFKIKKTVECPSFSIRKKISAFVQPEFGLSLPHKTLQEKIPDVSDVTAYRKENEKSLEGIHAAMLAGCFIGKSSFYLSTGLAYTRITEKLDLSYNYTRRDTTFGIISITKSQSGDTVTVIYGDIVTESTVEGQKIRHHYFHTYDIPLTVGYQWALSPSWNVNIEAGMLINVRLQTTGQVLRTLQDFTPVMKNEYQSSLGLGYKAGLGIEYLLKPEIGLGMQARVQGYGKTFTSPNSNFQQKYIIPGAHLYVRYYFAL